MRPLSSLKVTDVPRGPSTLRPVSIPVWLGRVTVSSWAVRALSVEAPSRMSRRRLGSSSAARSVSASGLSPSTELASTTASEVGSALGDGVAAGADVGAVVRTGVAS